MAVIMPAGIVRKVKGAGVVVGPFVFGVLWRKSRQDGLNGG